MKKLKHNHKLYINNKTNNNNKTATNFSIKNNKWLIVMFLLMIIAINNINLFLEIVFSLLELAILLLPPFYFIKELISLIKNRKDKAILKKKCIIISILTVIIIVESIVISTLINFTLHMIDKPILYLYPTKDTSVNIKLEHPELLKTTYPKYKDGWTVNAKINGNLYDENNKYYYALYWDEMNSNKIDFKEGFYVTKENAINFLEEKLNIIGLNNRERNEFIMYWLPKLEDNGKSLVYFELTEEREKNNRLIIEPKPDSLLRINIHIKKVNKKINIKEQKLTSFDRKGFVAVEWGGTIHN